MEMPRSSSHRGANRSNSNVLEENQTDSDEDYDPGDNVRQNKAVPELAIEKGVLFLSMTRCMFSDHR
jgi:hypothetical protein